MPLSIRIDADTGQVAKSIQEIKSDLATFKTALEKATDVNTITRLNKSIKDTEQSLKAMKQVGFDSKEIKQGAEQATNAMMNLGRVVQDAPYGFIGIANNINPLLESFQRLRVETGSNKAALQALAGSLFSGAGLGLAVSIATSLLVVFSDKLFKTSEAASDLGKNTKELQQSIDGVFKSVAEEATKVGTLVQVLESENETRKRKLATIKELQSIAPDQFKNLKMEGDAIVGLNASYQSYLANLKNVIAVRIQQARLDQLIEQQLKKQGTDFGGLFGTGLKSYENELKYLMDLQKKGVLVDPARINLLKQIINGQKTDISILNNEIQKLFDNIQQMSTGVKVNEPTTATDPLKKRIDALKELQSLTGLTEKQQVELAQLEIQLAKRDAVKVGFSKEELQQQIKGTLEKAFPIDTFEFGEALHLLKVKVGLVPSLVKDATLFPDANKTQFVPSETQIKDIQKATGLDKAIPIEVPIVMKGNVNTDFIVESVTNAFTDSLIKIGENLGKALESGDFLGGLKDTARAILSIIGDVLIEIGRKVILTSALVKTLKTVLSNLFGPGGEAAGIAVGVALVATGTLLKSVSFPKMADGGILTQSTMINAGEAGKEAIIPLAKLPYLMSQQQQAGGNATVGLRIKGRELLAFIEREQAYSKRLG